MWLATILLTAMALRLALLTAAFENPEGVFTPDSYSFVQLADHLAEEGEFRKGEGEAPEIFRTPGYPLFLLTGAEYGDEPHRARGWRVVLMAQVLLDVLLVGLTYLLAKQVVSQTAGLAAAAFQAVAPVAVASSCRLLSDSLYAFLLTAALLLFVRHLRGRGHSRTLMASAAIMAVACYVRPVGLVMAAIMLAVLLIRPHRLVRAGPFALALALALMPWLTRNIFEAGYFGFSSFAGDSAFKFSAPMAMARADDIPLQEARSRLLEEQRRRRREIVRERMKEFREIQTVEGVMAHWRQRRAAGILLARPLTAVTMHLRGCMGFWLPGGTDVLEIAGATTGGRDTLRVIRERGLWEGARHYFGGDTRALLAAAGMGFVSVITMLLAAFWCVRGLRGRRSAVGWSLFAIVAASTLVSGVAATPRFRVPVTPVVSLAAGAAVVAIVDALIRRRTAE